MPSSPGTVSKILWHFTGGPRWNEAEMRQEHQPKPIEDAYEALLAILRSRQLRLGAYREIIKVVNASENSHSFIKSEPVCCLADIPIMHLDYHASRYGKVAIGFHRERAIRYKFSPVFYQLHDSPVLQAIYEGLQSLVGLRLERLQSDLQAFESSVLVLSGTCDAAASLDARHAGSHIQLQAMLAGADLDDGLGKIEKMLAFIKSFDQDEFGTIYCEREWRSVNAFDFQYNDISMIVVPRSSSAGDYFDRFVQEARSIPLPLTVSIVAWEDLVEH